MAAQPQIPEFQQQCQVARWVAYFDLLGTRDLVTSGSIFRVFNIYKQALEQLSRHFQVSYTWFSDTFLLYTPDESDESFTDIDKVSRWFTYLLIWKRIPVRGALTYGDLYADQDSGVYLGQALVDSYTWGENQDWLGFVLTPQAVLRLSELGLEVSELLNYRHYSVPFKQQVDVSETEYAACFLGNWIRSGSDRRNQLIGTLEKMIRPRMPGSVRRKYENTLTFLRHFEPRQSD